jgi:hypothetical protein
VRLLHSAPPALARQSAIALADQPTFTRMREALSVEALADTITTEPVSRLAGDRLDVGSTGSM